MFGVKRRVSSDASVHYCSVRWHDDRVDMVPWLNTNNGNSHQAENYFRTKQQASVVLGGFCSWFRRECPAATDSALREHLLHSPQCHLHRWQLLLCFLALASWRYKSLPGLWNISVTWLLFFCKGLSVGGGQNQTVLGLLLVFTIFQFLCSYSFSKIICLRKQVSFIVQRGIIRD